MESIDLEKKYNHESYMYKRQNADYHDKRKLARNTILGSFMFIKENRDYLEYGQFISLSGHMLK